MKALKIPFEIEEPPYNPEFVAKIKEGMEQAERGEIHVIDIDNIWN